MYNKTKRNLEKAGGACCILMGVFLFIFIPLSFLGFGSLVFLQIGGNILEMLLGSLLDIVICGIVQLALSVVMIVIGAIVCAEPKKIEGEYKSKISEVTAMICLMAIIFIKFFVLLCQGSLTTADSILLLIVGMGLVLLIYSLCIKKIEPEQGQNENPLAIEEKQG